MLRMKEENRDNLDGEEKVDDRKGLKMVAICYYVS